MNIRLFNAIKTYHEIICTGEIQSRAEGENVVIEIKGNITGDLLIFISPKNNIVPIGVDIMELIRSDNKIEQQRNLAINSLRLKFKGLILLPESIVWTINIGICAFYAYQTSDSLLALFHGSIDFRRILSVLPLAILALVTPLLARTFGLRLLKPIVTFIVWIAMHIRKTLNMKGL